MFLLNTGHSECDRVNKYSKICLKRPLKRRPKIGLNDKWQLNEGQKYCIMLQGEDSAILSTFINLPIVIKTFVLSIFEWRLKTGFTLLQSQMTMFQHANNGTLASFMVTYV